MKSYFLLLFFLTAITSCSSGSDSVNAPEMEGIQEMMGEMDTTPSYTGEFVTAAHPTTGSVSVNALQSKITITGFKTDAGPILEMYLATDLMATDYVSLGELKGLEGDFVYDVPDNVDFETHNYLMVWCVDFSVDFGHAILE